MDDQPYQVGRLTQAVETLTTEVTALRKEVTSIKADMNRGKGFAIGMLVAAGGVGAGMATALMKLFGK